MKQPDVRSRRHFIKASSMFGLITAFSPTLIREAFANPKLKTSQKEDNMTQTSATGTEQTSDKTAIRPFQFNFPDAELADLRRRINATKWPERELVGDASQGVQLATTQKLARYWATDYDWRACEARLNALPHYVTEIDGLDIHFVHVRSRHENALPLIVTHGWPGSFIEQLKIVEPLTDRTAHGASASDAFHLVIPSLPGHGFSGKPTATGWDPIRIARVWVVLMKRLGYTRFVAQGGDWGNAVTEQMALQAPRSCSASTPTCPRPSRPTSRRRSRPAPHRRPASRPTSVAPTTSWTSSTRRDLATRPRWRTGRRRSTGSRTHRSAWRPGCSTTTRPATP